MTTKDIWNTYNNDLRYFILNKVKEANLAEDLLQDTFIKIHTKKDGLKDTSKLKPWLFNIARYTVLDYFKSQNKSIEINVSFEEYFKFNHYHTETDCLNGIIKNLPKKYRQPLFLYHIKGLKQQEVATI